MPRLRMSCLLSLLVVALTVLTGSDAARGQQVTGQQVVQAIQRGIGYLRGMQRRDGSWPDQGLEGGATALATLALLNAGVPADDPRMRRAIERVRAIPLAYTYVVSLKIQALVAADPVAYLNEITAGAVWLARAQRRETGMWGYTTVLPGADFSNTQFALLGLHEANRAGVKIPETVWRQAERAWTICQRRDGGWGYSTDDGISTGSMTAAGVASLYITGKSLDTRSESGFLNGQAPRCGRYAEYRPIAGGLAWLAKRFSAKTNPPQNAWYYYYMYGIERVGILSGQRYFGRHDWYREGAAELVGRQGHDGRWDESSGPIVNTSFALLFLAKGHKPILFHKLQWSSDQQWNLDRDDIAHLTAFLGDRLGSPVTWEAVRLEAPVEDWLAAPILYFNGHVFPRFDARAVAKLKEYVRQGGAILAEACCGRREFVEGFRVFARQAWPEFELHRLTADHPVFRSLFRLDGRKIQLEGIEVACRTSIFFSPVDLSCLWEQANIPKKSEEAFQLGANIAAYATGLEPLPDRLDVVRVAEREALAPTASAPVHRGAVHIAQLIHNGDWRPDPQILPNLSKHLSERLGVDVVPHSEALAATDGRLTDHPILYVTGHYTFRLAPDEITALRQHLRRGGFLFADACCGRKAFDIAFRELAAQLFPDQALALLPPTHPILAGSPGAPIRHVAYKAALLAEQPGLEKPALEGVTLDGRTVIVYSPYSLGCSIDGHACFACRGVAAPDATTMGANIILYALSY